MTEDKKPAALEAARAAMDSISNAQILEGWYDSPERRGVREKLGSTDAAVAAEGRARFMSLVTPSLLRAVEEGNNQHLVLLIQHPLTHMTFVQTLQRKGAEAAVKVLGITVEEPKHDKPNFPQISVPEPGPRKGLNPRGR